MWQTPHFVTGSFTCHNFFLPDEEYGRALDCLVKSCCDILITKKDAQGNILVLLAKRKVHPQPDWWFVGGRAIPGENPQQTVRRHLKRELGLIFDTSREIITVGHYSFVWEMRAQEPANHGTADISTVQSIEVSEEEAAKFSFCEKEYCGQQWLPAQAIIDNPDFHPALRRSCADMLTREVFNALQKAVQHNDNDKMIELSKQLVANEMRARNLPN